MLLPSSVEFHWKKFLMVNLRMAKIKITQVRSTIDRPKKQKDTIKALGLGKINRSVEVEATPQIVGMVRKVAHLVTTTEL